MKDLIKKNKEELMKELEEKKVALRDLRFGLAGSKNKNVKEYSNIKKDIARINTVLNSMK